jgi:hypothetical protein
MGWTSTQSLSGHETPKAYFDAEFSWANAKARSTVLHSVIRGRVYYAAVERLKTEPGAERMVFAVVCLFRHTPRARDCYILTYKDMDETVGPCERQCPAAILDLLTPTEYAYVLQWRCECRANLDKNKVERKLRPKAGDRIELAVAQRFTDGAELSRFKAVQLPRRRNLVSQSLENGRLYRISAISGREFRHILDDDVVPASS